MSTVTFKHPTYRGPTTIGGNVTKFSSDGVATVDAGEFEAKYAGLEGVEVISWDPKAKPEQKTYITPGAAEVQAKVEARLDKGLPPLDDPSQATIDPKTVDQAKAELGIKDGDKPKTAGKPPAKKPASDAAKKAAAAKSAATKKAASDRAVADKASAPAKSVKKATKSGSRRR